MKHDNNFDGLRQAAAFAVLVSHQFALSGRPEPMVGGTHTLGHLGVAVFFSMSGLLVAASWQRDPRPRPFALRRLLRIGPAFVVCLMVVGAAAALAMPEHAPAAWTFVRTNLLLGRHDGGFFPGQPHSELNGSLWTIRLELACYAALAVTALVARRHLATVLGVSVAVYVAWALARAGSDAHRLNHSLWYGVLFCAGAWLRLAAVSRRGRLALAAGGIALLAADRPTPGLVLLVPAAVAVAGPASWPVLRRCGRFGDISYGLYLWAWPVQQSVIRFLGTDAPIILSIALSTGVTLAIAWASWHGIERRALGWRRGPEGARGSTVSPEPGRRPPAPHPERS
ncbi:MAG TPA: acyltransferase [Variovorax sp.]|nr:acyltransferase [Variovorax sp.]